MGHYHLTLLVTFEQEIAIQDFFKENGWPFMKTGTCYYVIVFPLYVHVTFILQIIFF